MLLILSYLRKWSQEARTGQDWDWNSVRCGSKAENPWGNLIEATAPFPADADKPPSAGILVISYSSESDFEIGRLHVLKILVAHGITGTAVESEMRFRQPGRNAQIHPMKCLRRNPLLPIILNARSYSFHCCFWNSVPLEPLLPPHPPPPPFWTE